MRSWINSFEVIKSAVTILLRLTRNSQNLAPRYANNSFFQVNLDSQPITQLIRVKIGTVENVSEISVGEIQTGNLF